MQERDIFIEALQKETPAERGAYLHGACGMDSELRSRVERLLLEHECEQSFILDAPAPELASDATLDPPILLLPSGTVIGRYKLLEPIGEGGYGVVFMAEQTTPVKRKVALKIIKAGMDTRQVIARFEAERQALALMDHPNIAKVFDAGTTDAGRLYFVMELVKGVPITKYCDEHRIEPRQRLELFMQVCQAVQHAHQKGIIHRDIKPSNVLVAQYDGKPVPKVIDFGVAKATGQQLTERTMFTGFGDVIGTLEYMSPEQADMNQLDVDTRSDIYSLGVLLYELLTGSTPLEHKRVMKAGLMEMLRLVREEEPPKPSTRLSTSERLPSIAASRGLEPKKLSGLVHGELDWIVMKSLEKDRNRRYETANGFAKDIERYLGDDAVQACPPSGLYRFRKFARRNKVALLVASAAVIALLVAVAGLAVSNRLIAAERNQKARALVRVEEQSKRAEQSFLRASIAIREVLTKAAMGLGEWSQLPPPLRKRFSEEAVNFYKSLLQENNPNPDFQYETAVGYRAIGTLYVGSKEPQQAEESFRRSITILDRLLTDHPAVEQYRHQLAWTQFNLGRMLTSASRFAEAKSAFQNAASLYEKLVSQVPTSIDYRNELALCYDALAAFHWDGAKQAEDFLSRAIAILTALPPQPADDLLYRQRLAALNFSRAQVQIRGGQMVEATASFRTAAALFAKLLSDSPNSKAYHTNLTACLSAWQRISDEVPYLGLLEPSERVQVQLAGAQRLVEAGDFDGALAKYSEIIATDPEMVAAWSARGRFYRNRNDPEKAATDFAAAGKLYEKEFSATPTVQGLLNFVECCKSILDLPSGDRKQFDRVEQAYRELDRVLSRAPANFRDDPRVIQQTAHAQRLWAFGLRSAGRLDESEAMLRKALVIFETLTTGKPESTTQPVDYPNVNTSWQFAAGTRREIALVLILEQKPDEAETEFRRAIQMQEQRAAKFPDPTGFHPDLEGVYFDLARLLLKAHRMEDAVPLVARGMEIESKGGGGVDPQKAALRLAKLLEDTGDLETALTKYSEVIAIKPEMFQAWFERAQLHRRRKDNEKAAADLTTAGKLCEKEFAERPTVQSLMDFLGCCRSLLGVGLDDHKQLAVAEQAYQEVDRVLSRAAANFRDDPKVMQQTAHVQRMWAFNLGEAGRFDQSIATLRKAIVLFEKLTTGKPESATQPADYPNVNTSWHFIADTHRMIAHDMLRQHKPEEAEKEFRRSIEIQEQRAAKYPEPPSFNQEWADVYSDLARLLIKGHRVEEAVPLVTRAVEIESKGAGGDPQKAALKMGTLLEEEGDFDGALKKYSEAIAAKPNTSDAWIARGWLYGRRGEQDKSEVDFTKVIELQPRSRMHRSEGWTGRAFSHFHREQWEQAIADFSKAIELAPEVHTNWYHRGHAYRALAQWDKAAADFTKVLDGWPKDVWALFHRAQCYAQMQRTNDAIADLRRAVAEGFGDGTKLAIGVLKSDARFDPLRANDDFKKVFAELETRFRPALNTLEGAEYLRDNGKVDEAIKVCSDLVAREPSNDAAFAARGECRARGDFRKMIDDYSEAIKLKPQVQGYWHERAYAHMMLGEHEKSIADHSRSIELGDQDAGQRLRRGHSYRAIGDLHKAEEDYSRAIELNPGDWDGWLARARLYTQQHNAEKAKSDLASLMKLPMDAGAQNSVAWSLATDRDTAWRNSALAVELAEKAIAARPTDGMIWNTVGAARYRNGQWKEAITALKKSMELRNGGTSDDWFFLAMSYWQLDDKQSARKWYDEAVTWMEKNQPRNSELRRFRTEAQELLKIPLEKPTTKPQVEAK